VYNVLARKEEVMRGAARITLLASTVLGLVFHEGLVATSRQATADPAPDSLPRDVHPDSRNRLPLLKPDVQGVAAIRLHASGASVRWASALGRSLTELAILTTAREHDQPYEWSLHEMEAVAVGLESPVIDVVRHRRPLKGVPEKHAAIVQVGRELDDTHALSSATYARALNALGTGNLVDMGVAPGIVSWVIVDYPAKLDFPVHHTDTVDFDMLLEGTLVLVLDDGDHALDPGDVVIVNGIDHGWKTGPSGCRLSVFSVGTPPPA